VRWDLVSVAGQDESIHRPAGQPAKPGGKPPLKDDRPLPTDEELRADRQRQRELRDRGIDAPNPRTLRPNAPRPPRPGPATSP
jgi:hypothetical protein